jgi:hypothetical protein
MHLKMRGMRLKNQGMFVAILPHCKGRSELIREMASAFSIGQSVERDRLFYLGSDAAGCHAGCSAGQNGRSAARD